MHDKSTLLASLRSLIGQNVSLHGDLCQVIEILPEGPVLVLQVLADDTVIQANAQGEASRRVPRLIELHAWLGGTDQLDPRVATWLGNPPETS